MVYIKTYDWNCLIFASIVYHITVCSCAAVKTCVRTLNGSYISPNNTLTTSKILKSQKKRNSFKTVKDVLLIILSKNNGIVRIIEAKFDGEKRRNMQHTAEFAKWPR